MAVPTTEPTGLPPAGVPRGWGGGLRSPNPPSSLEIKHNPNRPSRGAAAGGGGGGVGSAGGGSPRLLRATLRAVKLMLRNTREPNADITRFYI